MARYMRSDLGAGHTRLRPPAVVGEGIVFPPIQGYLHPLLGARQEQRKQYCSFLRKPTVVTAPVPFVAPPIVVTLAPPPRQARAPHSELRAPTVIDLRPQVKYVSAKLTPSRLTPQQPRASHWRLRPPVVVRIPEVFYGPQLALTFSRRGAPKSHLQPPTVVGEAPQPPFRQLQVSLSAVRARTEQIRYRTMAGIRPPKFIGPGIVFRSIQVSLAPSHGPVTKSVLHAPTVIGEQIIVPLARPIRVALTPSTRGKPRSRLFVPAVVGEGVVFAPIYGLLTPINYALRPVAKSRLFPPTVITIEVVVVYFGPQVTLAYQSRRQARSRLPLVVYSAVSYRPVQTHLAYSRRGTAKSRLAPPTVVDTRVFVGPQVTLAYSSRGVPKSLLRKPTVIDIRPQTVYLSVTLAASKRGQPKSSIKPPAAISRDTFFGPSVNLTFSRRPKARYGLAAPAVVFMPEPVLYPVAVTLAYSVRGKPRTFLRRPQVVGAVIYFGPQINLTYSRRGTPKSELRPPVVIDLRPQTRYLAVHLTYSRRGAPRSRLFPPIIPPLAPPVRVTLARIRPQPVTTLLSPPTVMANPPQTVYLSINLTYSRRGQAKSELRSPVVIDLRPQVFYLSVSLTRIRPQPTHTRLSPSTVTEALPKAERDIRVTLAYSRRGTPKSELKSPTVIDLRPQTRYLSVSLAYSRRGRPKSLLFEPVIPPLARPVEITLVRLDLRRRRPLYELRAPTVVGRVPFAPIHTTLTYNRRGLAKPFLTPPAVVGRVLFAGPHVALAPQKRGKAKPFLTPPTIVTPAFVAQPVSVNLSYSSRGVPKSFLFEPVLEQPRFFGPIVSLAEPRRPQTKYGLAAPAVIGPGIYFRGIQTHLVRITHPPVEHRLFPPAVVSTFHPPEGDVCGFDIAGSLVTGMTEAESTICGSDEADGDVCGTDQQAT